MAACGVSSSIRALVAARLALLVRAVAPVLPPVAQERAELAHVPVWLAVAVVVPTLLLLLAILAPPGVAVLAHLVLVWLLLALLPAVLLRPLPSEEQEESVEQQYHA